MKQVILSSAMVLGAVLASSPLHAENGHNYNGSYCGAYYGSDNSKLNRQINGVYNTSSSGVYVSCPVIEDEIDNTSGTQRVWFHTSAANTTCVLYSMNGNGTARQAQAKAGGPGWVNIANLTSDDYWGSYAMYCYLPAGGTLNTIFLGERS